MALYEYRCPEHGLFDVIKPMADSGREERCQQGPVIAPPCGRLAERVYTASTILANGSSGDGYLYDSKSGLRSGGGKKTRWV